MKLGIRAKTILLTIVPTFTVAILLGAYFINVRLSDIQKNMQFEGANIVHQLGPLAEFALNHDNQPLMKRLTNMAIKDHDGVRTASLFSAKGKLLVSAGLPSSIKPTEIKRMDSHFTDKLIIQKTPTSLAIISTITNQDMQTVARSAQAISQHYLTPSKHQVSGYFVIEIDMRKALYEESQAYLATLFSALLGLFISILIGLRFGRDITRPIRAMARGVEAIKEGNLDTQVSVHTHSELDTLKTGINEMANALNNARAEMQKRVDQATHDLKTALSRLEGQNEELAIARKAALAASQVKSDFLANMSHEIRTPMNAIVGYTELLQQTQLDMSQRDYLEIIAQSTEGLMHIINDILDFSKIEADKLELHKEPSDIRVAIEDTLTLLAPLAHKKALELSFFINDDVPQIVSIDTLRFKQIITNLVNNAIKFTETGSITTRVSLIENSPSHERIHIEITDTGCGLTADQQKRLFKAFSQADTSTTRDFGGTGLGLVICQRLVHKMGGEINLHSEPGVGSTFFFSIEAKIVAQIPANHDLTLTGKTIGIIESFAPTRMHLMQTCESFGATVLASDDLNKITLSDCDILLMSDPIAITPQQAHIILVNADIASAHQHHSDAVAVIAKPITRRRLLKVLCDFWSLPFPKELQAQSTLEIDNQLSGLDILAVDDNDINLKLLETLLHKMGANVTAVNSGEKAIEAAQKNHFDLILMDIQMPKMDGVETTAHIRDTLDAPPPIIALTADALDGQREKFLIEGFDDFQTKPLLEAQLLALVQKWTNRSKQSLAKQSPKITPAPRTEDLPAKTIDLELGIQRAGGNEALAKELLDLFISRLTNEKSDLNAAYQAEDLDLLCQLIHKLHGGAAYVGTPLLQKACFESEKALKQKAKDWPTTYSTLIEVIDQTLSDAVDKI